MIRDATDSDLPAILEIERQFGEESWQQEEFLRFLAKRSRYFRVIEDDGLVTGYYIVSWRSGFSICDLCSIAIAPLYQGKGQGSLLMKDIISECQQQRFRKIRLEVAEKNSVARKMYSSWRFREVGVIPHYYHDDNAIRMQRDLAV
jgi:[ribosomal protein S18]-alanine N-acetyltransferase